MAAERQGPETVIHHSCQGTRYTSWAFGRRREEAGVRPLRSSVGDAYDNAMCTSFFATLECELARPVQRSPTRPRCAGTVFDFVEGFYNPSPRHSALGYCSPAEFERKHAAQRAHDCRRAVRAKPPATPKAWKRFVHC